MPSVANIPVELLNKEQKEPFLSWLMSFPLDYATRREYMFLWRGVTGGTFTREDWERVEKQRVS